MKKYRIPLMILFLATVTWPGFANLQEQNPKSDLSLSLVDGHKNLHENNRFYLSGQPTLEDLNWLKENGVTKIINLRGEKENEKFTENAFNERSVAEQLNMTYVSIPVSKVSDYCPEKLALFANELQNTNGKILIHCAGGGRVTYFMMAYYIKYEKANETDVIKFGEQLTYKDHISLLLGK